MDQQEQKTRSSTLYEFNANSNSEELAYLFLENFGGGELDIPNPLWPLLNKLIDDETLPEECAQQLLCIKVLTLMAKPNTLNEALDVLDKLNDPTYRLACFTPTYFQLVLLKADVLISQKEYELALVYVQTIYDLYSADEEFNSFRQAEKIKWACLLKMAIAAHFGGLENNLSYQLFKILQQSGSLSLHNMCNINSFMVFSYECFRVQKYAEAAQNFGQIFDCVKKSNTDDFPSLTFKKELEQEAMAMYLIAKKCANKMISKDEIQNFCTLFADMEGMSSKNIHLREKVVELVISKAKSEPSVTPMYNKLRIQGTNTNKGMQLSQNDNQKSYQAKNGSPRYD